MPPSDNSLISARCGVQFRRIIPGRCILHHRASWAAVAPASRPIALLPPEVVPLGPARLLSPAYMPPSPHSVMTPKVPQRRRCVGRWTAGRSAGAQILPAVRPPLILSCCSTLRQLVSNRAGALPKQLGSEPPAGCPPTSAVAYPPVVDG